MNRYHLQYREVDPTFTGIGKRYQQEEHLLEKPQFESFDSAQAGANKLNEKHPERHYYPRGNEFVCPKCGQSKTYDGAEGMSGIGSLVLATGMCQDCARWTVALHSANDQIIITPDFEMYFIKETVAASAIARPGQNRGHFGRKFEIRRLDTLEVLFSDDLWDRGTIPDAFRSEIRPNATIHALDGGAVGSRPQDVASIPNTSIITPNR